MEGTGRVKCDLCGKEYAKSYIKRHQKDVHGGGKEQKEKAAANKEKEVKAAATEILNRREYRIPPGEEVTDEELAHFLEEVEFIEPLSPDEKYDYGLKEMSISHVNDRPLANNNNPPGTPKTRMRKQPELAVQKKMEKRLGGSHQSTPAGVIDILTDTVLCEVKEWRLFKHALGQLMAYSYFYPNRMLHAHFFGPIPPDEFRIMVITILTHYRIKVTWEGQNGKQ